MLLVALFHWHKEAEQTFFFLLQIKQNVLEPRHHCVLIGQNVIRTVFCQKQQWSYKLTTDANRCIFNAMTNVKVYQGIANVSHGWRMPRKNVKTQVYKWWLSRAALTETLSAGSTPGTWLWEENRPETVRRLCHWRVRNTVMGSMPWQYSLIQTAAHLLMHSVLAIF